MRSVDHAQMRSLANRIDSTPRQQIGVLYWRYDADNYQTDPKFAVRASMHALLSRSVESGLATI